MTIRWILRKILGRGSDRRYDRGTTVLVEREPSTETEPAVTETSPPVAGVDEPATRAQAADGESDDPVQTIDGIGPAYAERLAEAGVDTVGDLAGADPADLADRTGLGVGRITDWIERAKAS